MHKPVSSFLEICMIQVSYKLLLDESGLGVIDVFVNDDFVVQLFHWSDKLFEFRGGFLSSSMVLILKLSILISIGNCGSYLPHQNDVFWFVFLLAEFHLFKLDGPC